MLSDVMTSFKAAMYERTTSPLLGSFVFFWVLFNWRLLLILWLGNDDIHARISEIERLYIDNSRNFTYPAFAAIVYSIAYPYIAVVPYVILRHANSWKIRFRNRIERVTTVSIERYLDLKTEIAEKEQEFLRIMDVKSSREQELAEALKQSQQTAIAATKELKDTHATIEKLHAAIGADDEALKDSVKSVIVEIRKMVAENYSHSLQSIARDMPGSLDVLDALHVCSAWLSSIERRAQNAMMVATREEVSEYIRTVIGVARRLEDRLRGANRKISNNQGQTTVSQWGATKFVVCP